MGPGTHIKTSVMRGVRPTSYNDQVSLAHDINYLYAQGSHVKLNAADNKAIEKFDNTPTGLIGKTGLAARKYLHLMERGNADNDNTTALAYQLKHEAIKKFGLNDGDFIF